MDLNIFVIAPNAISMIRLFALSIIMLALTGCATPDLKDATAEQIREGRLTTSAAFEALEEGDLTAFLEEIRRATLLRPGHPTLEYHLSRAYLMNEDTLSSLQTMKKLAQMGVSVDFDDSILSGLRKKYEGRDLELALQRSGLPLVASTRVYEGSDPNFQTEGIQRHQGKWIMASVHFNKVAWWERATLVDTSPRSSLCVATTASAEGRAFMKL
mgnify:CR=1 FL=1